LPGVPESAARPGAHRMGAVACAVLAAPGASGHEPHDDDDGHRDQPDDEERLERCEDPARSRDGQPDGEDRAEDCPDDPSHVPSMPPGCPCQAASGRSSRSGVVAGAVQAAFAIATSNAFTPDGSDGHFAWCIAQLSRADVAAHALGM
jgi:hypothetical protein